MLAVMIKLSTDADLADLLGLSVPEVRRFCRERGWPCVRPKRTIWLFTDEQIAQIVAMQTTPKRETTKAAKLPGQTARSAARSS